MPPPLAPSPSATPVPLGPLAQAAEEGDALPLAPYPPPEGGGLPPSPPSTELWRRFGASPAEAAEELVRHHLSDEEQSRLIRGYGWDGYSLQRGHYTGNIRGIPRLGIPSINMQDAGAGFRTMPSQIIGTVTSFPSSLAAAATWDRSLVRRYSAAIGREFKSKGSNMILGPGVNVGRVARNVQRRDSNLRGPALLPTRLTNRDSNSSLEVASHLPRSHEHPRDFDSHRCRGAMASTSAVRILTSARRSPSSTSRACNLRAWRRASSTLSSTRKRRTATRSPPTSATARYLRSSTARSQRR